MYLRIDSHSGSVVAPAPPARDSSPVVPCGYAGCCPCELNYEIPDHSRRKRSLYIFLNKDLRLARITNNKLKNRMHVDPHRSQPTECQTSPFAVFVHYTLFAIDLFDANERKPSPPGEPNANKSFIHKYSHPHTQTSEPDLKKAYSQSQQPYAIHSQISFDS